jgi:hypothetical protein
MIMSLRALAHALDGDVSGGQVLAPGPGHSPKDRSLAVKLDDGAPDGFIVYSHCGDDAIRCRDYVRGKIGLPPWKPNGRGKKTNGAARSHKASPGSVVGTESNGAVKPRKASLGSIVLTSDFVDENGTVLYQEVKYDPKDFRLRRPDGNGGWISEAKSVVAEHPVPYRLPEVLAAIKQGQSIAIVEGPKDANTLWEHGIPATTSACGASNTTGWHGALRGYFEGADIIITPDNDEAGFKYLAEVGAGLTGVAKRIRVLALPGLTEKGDDTSVWFAKGGTTEQWRALAEEAPDFVPAAPAEPAEPPLTEEAKAAAAAREKEIIDRLAQLSDLEYDRQRREAARGLGARAGTLDNQRRARRVELDAERILAPLFGWWAVEPWHSEVNGDDLIRRIIARIRRHVFLRENQAIVCAFWTLLTWVHEVCVHSPILLINSVEFNSGKSTLADVLLYLVQRGLGSVSLTGASLFRMIEKYNPTYIADEADKLLVRNEDVRDVINSGWTRGKVVIRCFGDDQEPTAYSTFCPKMIVMKGFALPENTRSRCLQIRLKRRKKSEPLPEWFQSRDDKELAELRRRERRWAMDHIKDLDGIDPPLPEGFVNREGANWRLMFAIADRIGGEWPKRLREAAIEICNIKDAVEASGGERLLKDIKALLERRQRDGLDPRMVSSDEIITYLHGLDGSFWLEFGKDEKPITKTKVARMLAGYGITSSQIRVEVDGKEKNVQGYLITLFDDAFERYIPEL